MGSERRDHSPGLPVAVRDHSPGLPIAGQSVDSEGSNAIHEKKTGHKMSYSNKAMLIWIIPLAMAAGGLTLYFRSLAGNADGGLTQKGQSLKEYLGSSSEEWFLTGKKKYSIQAMMVSKETTFHNDLEVVDLTATDDGETVVLKGTRDEIWTAPLSQVIARYTKPDGSELSKEDFANRDVYIDIVTIPTTDAYYAMHVPINITVTVVTAQGAVLHTNLQNAPHGEGDYLVCTIRDDGGPDLSDIWVLNGLIFPDFYDTSNMN